MYQRLYQHCHDILASQSYLEIPLVQRQCGVLYPSALVRFSLQPSEVASPDSGHKWWVAILQGILRGPSHGNTTCS